MAISATVRERSVKRATEPEGIASRPSFSTTFATTEIRFALPHRSP